MFADAVLLVASLRRIASRIETPVSIHTELAPILPVSPSPIALATPVQQHPGGAAARMLALVGSGTVIRNTLFSPPVNSASVASSTLLAPAAPTRHQSVQECSRGEP